MRELTKKTLEDYGVFLWISPNPDGYTIYDDRVAFWNTKKNRVMKIRTGTDGYKYISIRHNKKQINLGIYRVVYAWLMGSVPADRDVVYDAEPEIHESWALIRTDKLSLCRRTLKRVKE